MAYATMTASTASTAENTADATAATFFIAIPTEGASYIFGMSEQPEDRLLGFRKLHPSASVALNKFEFGSCTEEIQTRIRGQLFTAAMSAALTRMLMPGLGRALQREHSYGGMYTVFGESEEAAAAQVVLARALASAVNCGTGALDLPAPLTLPPWREALKNYADITSSDRV